MYYIVGDSVNIEGIIYKIMPGGILTARNRQRFLASLEDYAQAANRPYSLVPVLRECKFRKIKSIHSSCCHRDIDQITCLKTNSIVPKIKCLECLNAELNK